jgi:hypothetical protein
MSVLLDLALLVSTDVKTYTKHSTSLVRMEMEAEEAKARITLAKLDYQQKLKKAQRQRGNR